MHATTAPAPTPDHLVTNAPTFREYAWQWWDLNTAHLADSTITDYLWRLDNHLFGWFGEIPIDQITISPSTNTKQPSSATVACAAGRST